MKKFLTAAAAILFVAGFGLGGIGSYIYFSSSQECAQAIRRAEDKTRTAAAAQATAEMKKDAEYARQGAVMICDNAKERRINWLLFGAGAFLSFVIAAALLLFSRRRRRQLE